MTRPVIRLGALIALAAAAVPESRVAAQVLTIHLYDVSSAGAREITELKQTGTGIFEHSQIKVVWVECILAGKHSPAAVACEERPDASSIRLILVDDRDQAGDHVLGSTVLGTDFVTVNYRHAQKTAQVARINISCGRILAYVAAHEMGHVLLGSGNHSARGVMKAGYNDADFETMAQGHFFFTAEESRVMRERVQGQQPEPLNAVASKEQRANIR